MYKRDIVKVVSERIAEPRRMMQVVTGPRQVGKTFGVRQALESYAGEYAYRLADGLGVNPLTWLEQEWNAARIRAKDSGGFLLVIDEIQKVLGWSELVKRLWDEDTFNQVPLKVLLLGSSRLLLQKGLHESLAGRFELIEFWHWTYPEMREAFGYSVEDFIMFGGYPGAAAFRTDEARWRSYVRDAIIEPSISRDILQLETITKPALLRQLFVLACTYSAKILSYQKMLGQLQDAGNVTTLAHYLHLLAEAGLVCGLEKHYEEMTRVKSSSPKLAVCNNALITAMLPYSLSELRSRHDLWGRLVESAVGTHLLATSRPTGIAVQYWNAGIKEVDYVLVRGEGLSALEVKSEAATSVSGMKEFKAKYSRAAPHLIGGQGMPLSSFFITPANALL